MLKRTKIAALLSSATPLEKVLLKGWVRTRRDAKDFSFIEVNDGSCLKNMQIIANQNLENYEEIKKLSTGSSVAVEGALVPSQGGNQKFEVKAEKIEVFAKEKTHGRIFAFHCAFTPAHQQIWRGVSDSLRTFFCDSQVFPRARFSLCPHTDYHRRGL